MTNAFDIRFKRFINSETSYNLTEVTDAVRQTALVALHKNGVDVTDPDSITEADLMHNKGTLVNAFFK